MLLATLSEIHRYPVKSMGGESPDMCTVGTQGIAGDRAFALFEPETRTIASAKSTGAFPRLMDFGARYRRGGTSFSLGDLCLTLPDGRSLAADDPACVEALSAWFGRRIEIGAVTDPPERRPRGRKYTMAGTFFDYAPLHLLTSTSQASLSRAAPNSVVETRRFRPNLVLACDAKAAYPENDWVGKTLRLGAEIIMEVTDPCPRCVMITLAQGDLPEEPQLIRTLGRENNLYVPILEQEQPSLGVYAAVRRGGSARVGDSLTIVS